MRTLSFRDRPQENREQILEDFRKNVIQVVVATDVCARGIDIKDLDHVINLDLPDTEKEGVEQAFVSFEMPPPPPLPATIKLILCAPLSGDLRAPHRTHWPPKGGPCHFVLRCRHRHGTRREARYGKFSVKTTLQRCRPSLIGS